MDKNKILIFGNSGSGKSTLAKSLSQQDSLEHLDLDTLAWLPGSPPARKPLKESKTEIDRFISFNQNWVIEGCYADLLELVTPHATEIIFLNPGVDACIRNCRSRPWEPHKYASKEAQDANLNLLIGWVKQYVTRKDEFSLEAHKRIYESFKGKKTEST
jgi:adenylate kinase family enzyme